MPATDIISHPGLNGPHEAAVLGAGAQSAAAIGVVRFKGDDDANIKLLVYKGREVQIGDVFVRPVVRSGDQEAEGQGAFTWFGGPGMLKGAVKLNVANLPANAPGSNMLSPAGTPVFRDGERVVNPAVGQQAVDPWSGEPLFEPDRTTPILVTA